MDDIRWYEIDKHISNRIDDMFIGAKESLVNRFYDYTLVTVDTILAVFAIGIVGYLVYQCLRFMFLGKNEDFQKMLFSSFLLMLVRIITVVLNIKLGVV